MTEETQVPAEFVEEEKEGVAYIKPHIEMNLSDQKRHECREIVREIKNFGVNQRQILFLIDLLSLELENPQTTKEIRNAVVAERQKLSEKSKILLP